MSAIQERSGLYKLIRYVILPPLLFIWSHNRGKGMKLHLNYEKLLSSLYNKSVQISYSMII